jgi:tetratricopeptide (TPR) repeat protein
VLNWFNAREAAEVGVALADQFAPQVVAGAAARAERAAGREPGKALKELLRRADRDIRTQRLNLYQRAKFANSFKWRLLESGVEAGLAGDVTRTLVMHLSLHQAAPALGLETAAAPDRRDSDEALRLFKKGNKYLDSGAYAKAIRCFQDSVRLNPHHADAAHNLGVALCKLGRYKEAEDHFRHALELRPDCPEAHANLGAILRLKGHLDAATVSLRRAIRLKPDLVDARNNLGLALGLLGRLHEARAQFEKVLKLAPGNADALFGVGLVARMEGRFDETGAMFKRALQVDPAMPSTWAALVGIRKMTASDRHWLERAEEIAGSGIAPLHEADLRFAIGKYCDDVGYFKQAFQSYKRANALLKEVADTYDRDARKRFVDDLIRVYTPATIAAVDDGASTSTKPVLVVGMMRSGTSLAEQIICSHPAAKGAGELTFWNDTLHEYEALLRKGLLPESVRIKLANAYLNTLARQSLDARRIVDKAPLNSDYLGVIHSVFPKARIIYMQRNPIDACLSSYFQQFSATLNFTMDLSDLAHYYREHHRLMAHWRSVLPPGTILDVPYAELIADQEGWTRRILAFLGLDWDKSCLDFHQTQRPVMTASYWQVRQKIYTHSVGRWRNYETFIGPLLDLRDLDPGTI